MYRVVLVLVTALAAASPGWAQAPGAVATSDVAVESQSDFVARCTRETIASNPQAQSWAENACRVNWDRVVAAQPMVEAILTAAPETIAPVDASTLADRLIMIEWAGQPADNTAASGQMGDLEASIENAPHSTLSFQWGAVGQPVPYDVEQALRGRRAELTKVSCQALGPGETEKVYHVTGPGRAPFGLTIYTREAPTADASSFFNARVDLSGRVPTVADAPGEWSPMCSS